MSRRSTAAPPSPALVPGRDLAILLLLLVGIDTSGLLHVYSLGGLYSAALFYGLGAGVVGAAWGLLAPPAPRRGRGRRAAWGALVGGVGGACVGLMVQQLYEALPVAHAHPGPLPAVPPHPGPLPGGEGVTSDALGVILSAPDQAVGLTVALLALPVLALTIATTRDEGARRRGLTLLAVVWGGYTVANLLYHVTGGPVGPAWGARLAGPGGLALLGLVGLAAGALWRPFSPPVFLGVTLAVGLGLRLAAISAIPISMNLGDMLPLVSLSTDRLLAGLSPYHLYQMPYDLALTYWPLNLLPYVPFRALGLDLRGANLLLGPVVGGLLLWLRRPSPPTPRPAGEGSLPLPSPPALLHGGGGLLAGGGWACYAFGVLYLTPTMFQWDLVTAAPAFWVWLGLLFAVVAGGRGWGLGVGRSFQPPAPIPYPLLRNLQSAIRNLLPGLALGAAGAAGPLVLPLAVVIGGGWLRRGWRYAAAQAGAAALVGLITVGPFALWSRHDFWIGAVAWFNDLNNLPRFKWVTDQSWLYEIGLAGQFWQAGLEGWLKPLQIVLLAGLGLASWRWAWTPTLALRWGSAAYLLFMAVNPVIWPYLYTPALLGLVFALAARERSPN